MVRTSNFTLQKQKRKIHAKLNKKDKASGMRWIFLSVKHKIEIN